MKYKIIKSVRSGHGAPYAGPTCDKAKIEKGKIYDDKVEALRDAKILSQFNLVGFWVYDMDGRRVIGDI